MKKIKICAIHEIEQGSSQVFKTSLGQIAVFRTRKDQLFATAARCPHQGGPLAHGLYDGERHLSCPLHGYTFNVADGTCTDETLGRSLQIFSVYLEDKNVYVAKGIKGIKTAKQGAMAGS